VFVFVFEYIIPFCISVFRLCVMFVNVGSIIIGFPCTALLMIVFIISVSVVSLLSIRHGCSFLCVIIRFTLNKFCVCVGCSIILSRFR